MDCAIEAMDGEHLSVHVDFWSTFDLNPILEPKYSVGIIVDFESKLLHLCTGGRASLILLKFWQ